MNTPINTLRRGSAGYEAIEAVRRHGPMSGTAIAVEIEKPVDEIDQLLRFPVREGFLRLDEEGMYHLGDGTKLDAPVAPAPTVAAAPAPSATPPAAPPAQTEQQLRSKASRRFQVPPTVTAPVMQPLVTETESQIRARNNAAQKMALERAIIERQAISATAPATPMADAAAATAPAPRPVERPPFIAAYCSDGTYVIEQGTNRIELDLAETQVLFEHMAQVARVAA